MGEFGQKRPSKNASKIWRNVERLTMAGAQVVVQFLPEAVGGRSAPLSLVDSYRPHLRVGKGEHLGIAFCGGESSERIRLGVAISAQVSFLYGPRVDYICLAVGSQFQVLEGDRIVGVGVVSGLLA